MQKVSISIFDTHIANMYQDGDEIYLEPVSSICHKISPLVLSDNLKEIDTSHLSYLGGVAGFISDSLPGSFGNEILENFFLQNTNRYPTISDKLLFIGNRGLGAITYEPSAKRENHTQETLELKTMFEKAKKLKKGDDFHTLEDAFLVASHSFVGGARSKALGAFNLKTKEVFLGDRTKPLKKDFFHAIIKYDDTSNNDENKSTYSKVEYIYYLLAKKSGINMQESFLVEANGKHHFITKRFDINENAKRYHVHSLAGLLQLDYNIPRAIGYEDLLRTAVRLGATASLKQLFKQMLFNYMFVNQDDHIRNFSFMCDKDFKYKATPAYDLTFAKGKKQTIEHQLSLYAKPLSTIGIDDVVRLATEFSVDLRFVVETLEKMKSLREDILPDLLNRYEVKTAKQKQILQEINKRTLKGELS